MDYLHYNPVKHGYVKSPIDWPYSSLANCQRKGWYEIDWGSDISDDIMRMELE
jgi:putative transposase